MLRRRLFYGALVVAALALQIFNTTYLAHFLLALVLSLPLLSLLISLPAMAFCRVHVVPPAPTRGQAGQFQLRITVPWGLPLARITVRVQIHNVLTGQHSTRRLTATGVGQGFSLPISTDTTHCGQLQCVCRSMRVCDCLGLFALRRKVPQVVCYVMPLATEATALPEAEPVSFASAEPLLRAPRRGEDYELRPYRPGDPLRMVHWKQSAKLDSLVVREMQDDCIPTVLLSFDRFGSPHTLDQILDRLLAQGSAFLRQNTPFYLSHREPDGVLHSAYIENEPQLLRYLHTAMSTPAPLEGQASSAPIHPHGVSGPVLYYHIAAGEEGVLCQNLPMGGGAANLEPMR